MPRTGGGKAKLRRGSNQKMKSDRAGEPSQARADMEQPISIYPILLVKASFFLIKEYTLKDAAIFELRNWDLKLN